MRRRFTVEQIIGILRAAQQRAKRGGRCVGEGDHASSRDLGAEFLSLEVEVRRDGGLRPAPPEGARGGDCQVEEALGRSSPGQCRGESN